ncbi:MAG: T9SS type A sorting domain-containing protein [Chitinophagales bacterium]
MKSSNLTVIIFLLLAAGIFQLQAQITITQDNFPRQASFTDAVYISRNAGVVTPSEGQNQIWDYSAIPLGELAEDVYYDASNDPDFPEALNYYRRSTSFQEFRIPYDGYENIDAMGFYQVGSRSIDISFPITAISGGPNDVLRFPPTVRGAEGRNDYVKFPLAYQTQWSATLVAYTDFELTVAAFGLNQTPGSNKRIVTINREVVGEGKVIIPMEDGSPSQPIEVLMIKSTFTAIDSFFLAGAPAPAVLLNAFGIVQGQVTNSDAAYSFYTSGSSSFVFYADTDDDFYNYRPSVARQAVPINISHNRVCDVPSEGQSQVTVTITGGTAPYQVSGNFNGEIEENEAFIFILDDNETSYDIIVVDAEGNESQVFETGLIPCTKLPVELLSFEGELKTEGNLLQWTTASESNNQFFTLSYSTDGQNFDLLQKIEGNGTTSSANRYEFLHRTASKGTTYYQLSQTDLDGTTKNLGTISLQRGETSIYSIEVYPTATKHQLNIAFNFSDASESVTLNVYDMTGRVVKSQNLDSNDFAMQLNVNDLATGAYILRIENGLETLTAKFIRL